MELAPYCVALIAGGFTVIGVLTGSLITYLLALQLSRANARRDASRRLREAFAPELAALDPAKSTKDVDVERLLDAAWPRHHAAIYELAALLKSTERDELVSAWRAYYYVGGSVRFFDYYMGDRPAETFAKRVNAILKHAQA